MAGPTTSTQTEDASATVTCLLPPAGAAGDKLWAILVSSDTVTNTDFFPATPIATTVRGDLQENVYAMTRGVQVSVTFTIASSGLAYLFLVSWAGASFVSLTDFDAPTVTSFDTGVYNVVWDATTADPHLIDLYGQAQPPTPHTYDASAFGVVHSIVQFSGSLDGGGGGCGPCVCGVFEYHYRWPTIREQFLTGDTVARNEIVHLLQERDRALELFLATELCEGDGDFQYPYRWVELAQMLGDKPTVLTFLEENDRALEDYLTNLPCHGPNEALGIVCRFEYPHPWRVLFDWLFGDDGRSREAGLLLERRDIALEDWLRNRVCHGGCG